MFEGNREDGALEAYDGRSLSLAISHCLVQRKGVSYNSIASRCPLCDWSLAVPRRRTEVVDKSYFRWRVAVRFRRVTATARRSGVTLVVDGGLVLESGTRR